MDDNKNEQNEADNQSAQTDQTSQAAQAERKPDKQKGKDKTDFGKLLKDTYNDYKGEFQKIVWPSRQDLVKKTVTVIITSVLFGVILFIMDFIYDKGIQLFISVAQGQGWL